MQTYTLERQMALVTPSGQRYPIGKLLGQGSYGFVHEVGPGKIMKVLDAMATPNATKHLLEELTIQEKLGEKEPDVCPRIYEYGKIAAAHQYAVIMEQCEGTARSLFQAQTLDPEVVLDYYEQIAKILQRLEKYEFNHRDLKSDNVMYKTDSAGKRKFLLIDFGYSCITVDGKTYQGTIYFKPKDTCFRRSRDLAQLVYESMHFLAGDVRTFAQLVLTFDVDGKTCDMSKACKPFFDPSTWGQTYKFLNRPGVENPNTTPEGLLKAVEAYRQGGLAACRAGFITNPITGTCVPVPPPPVPSALKLAVSPKPHVASPAVATTPPKKKRQTQRAKPCPPGKELNPKTKRCIKKKVVKTKACPPGKVLNPATGRCIKEKK